MNDYGEYEHILTRYLISSREDLRKKVENNPRTKRKLIIDPNNKFYIRQFSKALEKFLYERYPELFLIARYKPDLSSKEAFIADRDRIAREAKADDVMFFREDPYSLARYVRMLEDDGLYYLWLTVELEFSHFVRDDLRLKHYARRHGLNFNWCTTYWQMLDRLENEVRLVITAGFAALESVLDWEPTSATISENLAEAYYVWEYAISAFPDSIEAIKFFSYSLMIYGKIRNKRIAHASSEIYLAVRKSFMKHFEDMEKGIYHDIHHFQAELNRDLYRS